MSRILAVSIMAALGLGCARTPTALKVDDPAPQLRKVAHDGTTVDLTDPALLPLVVYFYPKDATPGCTKEACAFRDVWDRYAEAGVHLVGVSADDDASHEQFAAEHGLPFPLIADEDLQWAAAFGVGTTMGLPHRDTFVIGTDGRISHVYRGVDPGVHAEQVLADATGK